MSDLEKVDSVNHSTRSFEVIRIDLLNQNLNIYKIFLSFSIDLPYREKMGVFLII